MAADSQLASEVPPASERARAVRLYVSVGVAVAVILGLALVAVRRPLADALAGRVPQALPRVDAAAEAPASRVRWVPVATGFKEPVDLQFVPGRSDYAIVLEKPGRARLLRLRAGGADAGSSPVMEPVRPDEADEDVVQLEVHSASELGLLGLAFHPRYLENGLFYLNDNPDDGGPLRTRISEWRLPVSALGRERARLERVLLEIEQPYRNHDGGQVAFGPDGYLYIGMGDGGHRADPQGHGQNLSSLLGKMLRIDVDARPRYAVPRDNPFVGRPGVKPEIWAYGLRNPWRFSFDPKGRLVAADVGQDLFEEIDIVSAGDNLGWVVREAAHCFSPAAGCPSDGFVDPIFEYGRHDGSSVTGGHVYLGRSMPGLHGKYLFADFVSGNLWALVLPSDSAGKGEAELLGRFPHAISAFGRDLEGEIYALDFTRGLVLKLSSSKPAQ